ncbi:MAG: endonuclease MutS2 [Desulfovibrio sp.]|uniref:endonuclease MutS2 n=1 Tax=Desulfovibrio sp. 7SRBS1 TaxID=3378064 RepID=UPI003B3C0CA5
MESGTLGLLEFSKVLEALSGFAASHAGKQACRELHPFFSQTGLERDVMLFEDFLAWSRECRFSLGAFPELDGLFVYLGHASHFLDLDALYALGECLSRANSVREEVRKCTRELGALSDWAEGFEWPVRTASALRRCIDLDGRLKDESSPELYSVRQEIRSLHQSCAKKARDFAQQEGIGDYLQEEFITISSDRYVLPLKTNFKGKAKGIIHDYSQTGETCYFEPFFLVELNNRLQDLKKEEREEEIRVFKFLTGLVRDEFEAVQSAYYFLVEADVLQAKVGLAAKLDAVSLLPDSDAPLALMKARHPLLALNNDSVQPQDIRLAEGVRGLLVSGGNAGGKTVCLKTLGLVSLMALSALPVPVQEGSTLPRWNNLIVFLGDEQSLEENLSTFTAQVSKLGHLWPQIGKGSLVILDEFGAGTDPTQGAALAQAVIDATLEKGAFIVAATHFPGLKAHALSNPDITAASVMFDPKTRKPLFKLAYDQVGASIALEVALEHGLPEEIWRKAEDNLLLEGADTTEIMARLNQLAVDKERELEGLQRERVKLKGKRERLLQDFAQEKEQLFEELRQHSQDIVRKWREGKMERKKALKELAVQRDKLAEEQRVKEDSKTVESLGVGDTVLYSAWNKTGRVLELNDKKGLVKLDLDGVSMWVGRKELAAPEGTFAGLKKTGAPSVTVKTEGASGPAFRLDIRGMRAEPALNELARFVDQALLAGRGELEVIHGRGSGALRREVHAYLKSLPNVGSFQLANEDDGGDGKTIIELA